MARMRDISRTRKSYSYYRPRPRFILLTDEEEMMTINETVNTVSNLNNIVSKLVKDDINIVWNECPVGDIDGVNTVFTLAFTPIDDRILVFVNGVLQERDAGNADFFLVNKTITFNRPPRINSKILVTYNKA
jgi:hypothetical protein